MAGSIYFIGAVKYFDLFVSFRLMAQKRFFSAIDHSEMALLQGGKKFLYIQQPCVFTKHFSLEIFVFVLYLIWKIRRNCLALYF